MMAEQMTYEEALAVAVEALRFRAAITFTESPTGDHVPPEVREAIEEVREERRRAREQAKAALAVLERES